MIKNMIWMLVRVFIAFLMIGPTYAILILSNTATPVFLDTTAEALAWISCFLLVIGYVLIRFSETRYVGKLLSLSVLGAVVLVMYLDERYRIFGVSVNAWSLFLAVLYLIMLLYFIFPIKQLKPLLSLVPVAGVSWFLVWAFVGPISLTYELISNKATISIANYQKVIDLLPEVYSSGFQSGLFSMLLVIWLYAFVVFGHNPKRSYQKLATYLAKSRNVRHL
ncbi:hypothetical protein Q5H80_18710 [Vibrio sp. SNU_ST1]|uniref:hypothetical protein n=1 Tax=Vibrio sp. SNU_ST1 TaxID=3064001 RepID=UPI00272BB88B|nr:hypothetical protein [Vibrio sp. SNU_ST1]WKY59610.1 hypothetical protein Q5H80_18710 [Vibrio sp. SNU_ST1]